MGTVGFVGVGDGGSRMVPHLLRLKRRVVVFDVNGERIDAMTAVGSRSRNGCRSRFELRSEKRLNGRRGGVHDE
jgi:6-phosphogluconate dehydrogenase (decarboxylating)